MTAQNLCSIRDSRNLISFHRFIGDGERSDETDSQLSGCIVGGFPTLSSRTILTRQSRNQKWMLRLAASYQLSAISRQLPENCLLFAFNFTNKGLINDELQNLE